MKNQKRKLSRKTNKTIYVAYVAGSIDGRIARDSRSKLDWTSKEDWNFFQNSLKKFDAVVVGRNTFEVFENRLKRRKTIVFTSKAGEPKREGSIIFFNPKKSDFKEFIKSQNYRKIAVLGGPKIYNFFLERGMLDELYVTIEPYVFTAGVPMFSGVKFKKYGFSLKWVKKLNPRGTVLLKYKKNGN